jgi:hypothetical protein
MGQTNVVCTGRHQPPVNPMTAQIAFFRDSSVTVEGNGIIGAYVNAEATSSTRFLIQNDNTVVSFLYRLFRTRRCAFRFITMPADIYPIDEIHLGPDHSGTIFGDMNQFDSIRRTVFLLTGNLTGFAPPAGLMVYDQCESIHDRRLH